MKNERELYLLVIEAGIEPFLKGPYDTEEERLKEARRYRAVDDDQGLFAVDVGGPIDITSFTYGELRENQD